MSRVIIVGGGLAGSLAALALSRRRPRTELLVIEQGTAFGGNHTWSFFDSDIPAEARWVIEGIDRVHWPSHDIRFPRRSRTIAIGYNSMRSSDLDRAMRGALRPDQYRLGAGVSAIAPHAVTIDGEEVAADAVIDARGPSATPGLDLGWQKFVGRYYRFARPHGIERPIIMDGTVQQIDGYRFVYQLPVSATELLIEDTYYSAGPLLDRDALRQRIDDIALMAGGGQPTVVEEEEGVLPIVIGGDVDSLWEGSRVPLLGVRGGFFHPTTSYSLPDAVANAAFLAGQDPLDTASLRDAFHERARTLWRERGFFRMLNRMLFRAAEPGESYRVLEHFYRLPPGLIGRFYAARLTALDKVRLLSGRPPVPVGRALSALLRSAA